MHLIPCVNVSLLQRILCLSAKNQCTKVSFLSCLTEKLFNRLRAFHARYLRAMCRVNRLHTHHISTTDLFDQTGLSPIDSYITHHQLRWFDHVTRTESERLPRKMLTSWVREKRPRGALNILTVVVYTKPLGK